MSQGGLTWAQSRVLGRGGVLCGDTPLCLRSAVIAEGKFVGTASNGGFRSCEDPAQSLIKSGAKVCRADHLQGGSGAV
jgi:hypothetical protein